VKEKSAVDSPLFGAFPSDRIPKATKDANVYFFIHISDSSKFYKIFTVNFTSELGELFEATTWIYIYIYIYMCVCVCVLR